MDGFQNIGKLLIVAGVVAVIAGVILFFFNKIPFFGKLPGDIFIQKKNFTFYFPVVTSIVLSILLSLIFYFISKWKR
jgi:hypothetical protein